MGSRNYDGFTIGFQKRMSKRLTVQANYTFAHAIDDVLNSTLASEIQTGEGVNFLAISGHSDSSLASRPLESRSCKAILRAGTLAATFEAQSS